MNDNSKDRNLNTRKKRDYQSSPLTSNKKKFSPPEFPFVTHLEGILRGPSRQKIYDLKQGFNKEPGSSPPMMKHVIPWTRNVGEWESKMHYLIASLMAFHPFFLPRESRNLGHSCARLARKTFKFALLQRKLQRACNSIERNLHLELFSLFRLLNKNEIPVNYHFLLFDLMRFFKYSTFPPSESWMVAYFKEVSNVKTRDRDWKK